MASKQSKTGKSVEDILVEKFLAMMSDGIIPWHKPWFGTDCGVYNLMQKKDVFYRGINELLCYKEGAYLTRKQMIEIGATFKDEKSKENGTIVVYYKPLTMKTVKDEESGETMIDMKSPSFVLRYTPVWHISDLNVPQDILDKHLREKPLPDEEFCDGKHILKAQAVLMDYINREHIKFTEENGRAYYSSSLDLINVPSIEVFFDKNEYYSTLAHESVHSTLTPNRCNRKTGSILHRRHEYSFEELVAEMGAASLLNRMGINTDATERNSAAYLQGWMQKFKDGSIKLIAAARQTTKAVEYILNIKTETE